MTVTDPTRDDNAYLIERERAVEALTAALEAEESDEKDYQIREALQLLALKDE